MRSGSTLQYNIAAELIERAQAGSRAQWIDDHEAYFASYRDQPGLIVFKSHILTPQIKAIIGAGAGLVLTCHRDVRDCVASWQSKTGGNLSFQGALDFSFCAINQLSGWEELNCTYKLVSRYEDFAIDADSEIQRVAEFLGLELDPGAALEITSALTTSSLQERLASLGEDDLTMRGGSTWDTKTLLHINHFNGGLIGRAKEELSNDLYSALTDIHSDWLLAHGYSL